MKETSCSKLAEFCFLVVTIQRLLSERAKRKECKAVAMIKILVIGANEANVLEIEQVVKAGIGGNAQIMSAMITNYREAPPADLYVCLINRKTEIETVFSANKVVALTLVPPTEFFLELARIPATEPVVIFNNSVSGTKVLTDCLKKYRLSNVRYEVVPYDEMDPRQVVEMLSQAKYIIGGTPYVGQGSILYERFKNDIPMEAKVLVSPPRLATAESLSRLSYVYSTLYHQSVMKKLKRLSRLDGLTKLPNRRAFDEYVRRQWKRAQRMGRPLSLAMIDVDFFKYYNDCYGHVAGDECLKVIAHQIDRTLKRCGAFCARYGGEEFVIVLPNTDSNVACRQMGKVQEAIASRKISHPFSPADSFVTVSIGITTAIFGEQTTSQEILELADQALYQAKQRGRNRLVFAAPTGQKEIVKE